MTALAVLRAPRAPREAYVRAVVEIPSVMLGIDTLPVEVITGVEMRNASEYAALLRTSRQLIHQAIYEGTRRAELSANFGPGHLAELVELCLLGRWPDRAYFIEVCIGGDKDGWVQIYQPWAVRQ